MQAGSSGKAAVEASAARASRRVSRGAIRYHLNVSALVPSDRRNGLDLESLHAQLTELDASLLERRSDVDRTRADYDAFRIRYRQEVGLLHDELDRLELDLAEAELGILKDRLGDTPEAPPDTAAAPEEAQPRFTSDAIRKLFRDVAKAIHPDLAGDAATRDRRHSLMVDANRAYALGDEEQLRAILEAWERSPEAVHGSDEHAMRLRLIRRLDQIEEELQALAAELASLTGTSLWKLKLMVDQEAALGKDLIKDMVRRLKRDIVVATNRLNALRPPG